MTTRSFTPDDLVVLPRLDANEAVALASSLATAAEAEGPLPAALTATLAKVTEAAAALTGELGPASVNTGRPDLGVADRAEDNAVGALEEFLSAWSRLPSDVEGAAVAVNLYATLFGDAGLGFLKLKARAEWAQVEARLKQFDHDRSLASNLASLGGTPFLTHLRAVHADYGVAAGVTQVAAPIDAPKVRAALDALTAAMRRYVVRVASSVDESSPRSEARAEALLKPITAWVSAPVAKTAAAPAKDPPTPPTA